MDGSAWKKLILMVTGVIILMIWITGRPHNITSEITGRTLYYYVKTIGHGHDLPLIIALHGNGDTPVHFFDSLFHDMPVPSRILLIRGPFNHGGGYGWPMSGEDMELWGETLADIVPRLTETYHSKGKPILTGFSSGGFMAYHQAAAHPDEYIAIIPISGGLTPSLVHGPLPENQSTLILAFHGKDDDLIPFSQGKNAAGLLKENGRNVQFTPLPGGHLSIFDQGHDQFIAAIRQTLK